ncbi:MAG: hypothetical protein SO355_00085 [Candidatus Faecousia sp.]|nr:hypothetical protein [Candidatus Faecousia sp.]
MSIAPFDKATLPRKKANMQKPQAGKTCLRFLLCDDWLTKKLVFDQMFRPATILRRCVERKNLGIFVGNAFMHSACVLFQNRLDKWENIKNVVQKLPFNKPQ